VCRGALDLILSFAQLRLDLLKVERFIDRGFASRRDDPPPATQPGRV